jgi:endogenous inhibitor of DNA gyrase (YacG/DUF329 family)
MKHDCPICRASTDSEKDAEFPFCCERCRVKDFGNWATEKYVVSDPIFNEDDLADIESAGHDRKTFIIDLDKPNESEHQR